LRLFNKHVGMGIRAVPARGPPELVFDAEHRRPENSARTAFRDCTNVQPRATFFSADASKRIPQPYVSMSLTVRRQ